MEVGTGIWDGSRHCISSLSSDGGGFFPPSLLYSFEVLVAMTWIRFQTDRNVAIVRVISLFCNFSRDEEYAQFWE